MSGENPESMGDMTMDQAMSYTDQATDQAQTFNEEQVKQTEKKVENKKKVKKQNKELPDPKSPNNSGSFFEQILEKSLESDPNAINVLSNLNVPTPQTSNKAQQKEK